jgi:hypothetical protein
MSFEGSGATILFSDYNNRKKLIFALRNPDYSNNEKKLDECEYPGGKVEPDDYMLTTTPEEAAFFAAKREWDEEVFSILNEELRKSGNDLFSDFLMKSTYVDVQGGKSKIRLFMPEIDLQCKINDGREMLYSILKLADKSLEEQYEIDKTNIPLRGLVEVDLEDVIKYLKDITNDIQLIEKETSGGKLMKIIAPYCEKRKLTFTRLGNMDTLDRSIRKFNFFTLRALMQKLGHLN